MNWKTPPGIGGELVSEDGRFEIYRNRAATQMPPAARGRRGYVLRDNRRGRTHLAITITQAKALAEAELERKP